MRRLRKKKPNPPKTDKNNTFFPSVQTKLAIGKSGDQYEQEADAMADKVTSRTSEKETTQKMGDEEEIQKKSLAKDVSAIQKMDAFEDEQPVQKQEEEEAVQAQEEEEPVQAQEEEEAVQAQEEEEAVQAQEEEEAVQAQEEEEPVQMQEEEETAQAKEDTQTSPQPEEKEAPVPNNEEEAEKEPAVAAAEQTEEEPIQKQAEEEEESIQAKLNGQLNSNKNFESKLNSHSGKGSKMNSSTLSEMEHGFGADFSNINIHTDSKAVELNKDLGAHAFTRGSDIYFNEGKYDPNSTKGKHLLAHELTHTIQQKGVPAKGPELKSKGIQSGESKSRTAISTNNLSIQKNEPQNTESSDLKELREILEWWDVPEEKVIELFGKLIPSEANIALTDSRIKSRTMRVHTNEGIYMSMKDCKGSLTLKLTWLIEEGTSLEYVKDVVRNSNGGEYKAVLDDIDLKLKLVDAIGIDGLNEIEDILKAGEPELELSEEALGTCIVEQTKGINEGHTANSGIHYPNKYRFYANSYDPDNAKMAKYKQFSEFWDEDYSDGYANPEYWTRNSFMNWTLKEDKLASEAIQDWLKGLTIAECASALVAVELETVRKVIGNVKFDQLFSKVVNEKATLLNINQSAQESSLKDVIDFDTASNEDPGTFGNRNVQPGEWHYFSNHPAHILKHPSSFYQGENAIYMGEENGEQLWSGLGVKSVTELDLLTIMAAEYNQPRNHTDFYYLVNGPVIEKEEYDSSKDYETLYYDNLDMIAKEYRMDGGIMPAGDIDAMDIVMDPPLKVQGTVRKGGFVQGVGKRLKVELIEQL